MPEAGRVRPRPRILVHSPKRTNGRTSIAEARRSSDVPCWRCRVEGGASRSRRDWRGLAGVCGFFCGTHRRAVTTGRAALGNSTWPGGHSCNSTSHHLSIQTALIKLFHKRYVNSENSEPIMKLLRVSYYSNRNEKTLAFHFNSPR